MEKIFCYEDIIYLNDDQVKKLLREIDTQVLAIASKIDNGVFTKMLNNMSVRAGNMCKEDIEFMGPVRFKDYEKAQEKIIDVVFSLFGKNGH